MSINEQIEQDFIQGMKDKDAPKVSTLRMLKSALTNRQIQKKEDLTEEEILSVIQGQIKSRQDSIELYQKGGRQELAQKETTEIDILKKYLPEQLSAQEITAKVKDAIAKTGAKEIKDMGKVMGILSGELKGTADMGLVSRLVRENLQ